jgi:hypothetical protein
MPGLTILLLGLLALCAGILRGARYCGERCLVPVSSTLVQVALGLALPVLGFLALGTLLLPFAFVPPFVGLVTLVIYSAILWKTVTAPLVPGKAGPIGEGVFFGTLFALVLKIVIHNL